jgi:hypothetical protein
MLNYQGFVGYSTSKKRIAVVMRGSTTATDIINDIDTTLVTPSLSGVSFPSDVRIMTGVYTPWSSVHASVITEVRRLIGLYPTYTLESTGHSLGGSLTYMSYIALAQNFPTKSITSNALAAFPIGNAAFAAFGTAQAGLLRRGNNYGDGVPVSALTRNRLARQYNCSNLARICTPRIFTTASSTMVPELQRLPSSVLARGI